MLNRFYRYVEALLQQTLQREPPEGLRRTILSAVEGAWVIPGYRMDLKKVFAKAATYDLWFMVEPLPEVEQFPIENRE